MQYVYIDNFSSVLMICDSEMVQAMLAHSYLAIFMILISRLTFKESISHTRYMHQLEIAALQ